MAIGLQVKSDKLAKKLKKKARRKETPVQGLPPEEAATGTASHVVGKLAEQEPDDNAHRPHEEPEAAARSEEGLDAGYGRCSESSDFANRGRDRS